MSYKHQFHQFIHHSLNSFIWEVSDSWLPYFACEDEHDCVMQILRKAVWSPKSMGDWALVHIATKNNSNFCVSRYLTELCRLCLTKWKCGMSATVIYWHWWHKENGCMTYKKQWCSIYDAHSRTGCVCAKYFLKTVSSWLVKKWKAFLRLFIITLQVVFIIPSCVTRIQFGIRKCGFAFLSKGKIFLVAF